MKDKKRIELLKKKSNEYGEDLPIYTHLPSWILCVNDGIVVSGLDAVLPCPSARPNM